MKVLEKLQAPFVSAVREAIWVVPSKIVSATDFSAVPVSVSVLALVMKSALLNPLSGVILVSTEVTGGRGIDRHCRNRGANVAGNIGVLRREGVRAVRQCGGRHAPVSAAVNRRSQPDRLFVVEDLRVVLASPVPLIVSTVALVIKSLVNYAVVRRHR